MMRNITKFFRPFSPKVVFIFFWLLISYGSYGQRPYIRRVTPSSQLGMIPNDSLFLMDVSTQLLPFENLYDLAVTYSPVVKIGNEQINAMNEVYRLSKLKILENATGFANYSAGNQAIISNTAYGEDAIGQIANGYRAGVGLQVNLYDLLGRKQLISQAQSNYRASIHQRESVELQLKRDLITLYQDLLTAQRILKVRLEDEKVSLTAYRIAEVELQLGRIAPDAMAALSYRHTEVKASVEQAKGEFLKFIYHLEALVGVPLHQLKRN